MHNVFHVSQLKEYRDDFTPVFSELPKMPQLDVTDTQPERVADGRLVKKGNTAIVQVKVKWTGIPEEAATWEDWSTLKV